MSDGGRRAAGGDAAHTGRGFSARGWEQAIPDFSLAAVFALTWFYPGAAPNGTVEHLLLVMLLEFIIVHSSGFVGVLWVSSSPRNAALAVAGLSLFYALFAAAFAAAFHTWWPVIAFGVLTFNRLLPILVRQADDAHRKALVMRGWVAHAMFYLGGVFVTLLADLPRGGLTPDVVASLHLKGGGAWVDEPHRVLAFGALYFTLVAVSGAFGHAWIPWVEPTLPRAGRRPA